MNTLLQTAVPATFDAEKFKTTTRAQWQSAAEAWHRWGPFIGRWLGDATEAMFELARVGPGCRVLDVAAGAGEQSLAAARRVGPGGHVLATDIAPALLAYAESDAQAAGLGSVVATQEIDGEALTNLPAGSFDVAISRVGLHTSRPAARTVGHEARAQGGRARGGDRLLDARPEWLLLDPREDHPRARPAAGSASWSAGAVLLGGDGVLAAALAKAGFKDIAVRRAPSPVKLPSATECVRFERESFGALHQMMSALDGNNVRRSGSTSRRRWPRLRRKTDSSARARCWSR